MKTKLKVFQFNNFKWILMEIRDKCTKLNKPNF